jgi:hypothetical protein
MTGYATEVPGGAAASLRLRRHRTLTLRCLGPGANAAVLIYALDDPTERLNVPDTLKAQISARIRPPMALMSDMGRALASVTGSSLDWHDAITGHSLPEPVESRFGPSSYSADRDAWRRSARHGLLDELWKHGLDARDLHANVNFFSKVAPADDARGTLAYRPGHAREGDWVTLRAEIDVLVVLSTAPHPLDCSEPWDPAGVRLEVAEGPAPGPQDPTRGWRAEAGRALELADRSLI